MTTPLPGELERQLLRDVAKLREDMERAANVLRIGRAKVRRRKTGRRKKR